MSLCLESLQKNDSILGMLIKHRGIHVLLVIIAVLIIAIIVLRIAVTITRIVIILMKTRGGIHPKP